jgi:paraquat-inducible protein A
VTINDRYPEEAKILKWLVLITSGLLGFGLVTPIFTMNKFIIFEDTFSVLSGAIYLLKEGQVFLFMIITGFSVLLPIFKVAVLYKIVCAPPKDTNKLTRYIALMHRYGRWSMLDVFVVAILVVSVKLGGLASVEMRPGLYAFTAAVLLTMYVTSKVEKLNSTLEK